MRYVAIAAFAALFGIAQSASAECPFYNPWCDEDEGGGNNGGNHNSSDATAVSNSTSHATGVGVGVSHSSATQRQGQQQGQVQGQGINAFNGNETRVLDNVDSRDFKNHAERAASVPGSESGCQTGVSVSTGVFGGSLGGSSVGCDTLNALRAIKAAEDEGESYLAWSVRATTWTRNTFRLFLSIGTLGLL